ncbi:hypothetical protein BFJ68_g2421 [Fusarium oxysporum]|uniref:Extracellular membrane protein CFEM domain-containing protein n=1 Tax=Fusarium oxysporum TaxID=5507 RepID=A0A420PIM6_FUSOX|nr:hypothetical protein BFJ71_g10232 [Fusarium oxysporum]RKL21150.1 hypothetical protein BFJ68_g2421 [Fusarium oxysporum]
MKPVAILLALASTACTVSAGLPRFAKCTAPSQCNSNYCAPMTNADCDEVVNCRDSVCYGASVDSPCSNDWECNSNHCKGTALTTPYQIFTNASQEEDAMTAVILAT